MKFSRSKTTTTTIALFLMLTVAATPITILAATAQEPIKTKPFAFINAMPNVVGLGEYTLIHYGVTLPTNWPQTGWTGLSVEIEKPDGSTETLSSLTTDLTGGGGVTYAPTMVGTYHLRTHFPEQLVLSRTTGFPNGTIALACTSEWFDLIVQEEPAPIYPDVPLPTEYWSRPIDAQFRGWSNISGSVLEYARSSQITPASLHMPFNDDAPESSHILWAKPLFGGAFSPLGGGLAGGATGVQAVEDGDAYEGLFTPPIIMSGVIYYNRFKSGGGVEQDVVAVDLRTGEELWVRNWDNRTLDFGQSFFYTGFNYHAVFQYLWETTGTTWNAYEPTTGRWVYSMENVPRGNMMRGPNGEIIVYTIDLENGWMSKWNSRWVIDGQRWVDYGEPGTRFGSWLREYMGKTLDARVGIEWNVTIPKLPGGVRKIRDGVILGSNFRKRNPSPDTPVMWAIGFDPGHDPSWENIVWTNTSYGRVPRKDHDPDVRLLFNRTWTAPEKYAVLNIEDASLEEDVFTVCRNDAPTVWGFQLSTGEELWGPFGPMHYQTHYSYESSNSWDIIAYGKYYAGGHGGTLYALDAQTGESLWNFTVTDLYNEYLFNNAWRFRIAIVTDGKLYLEHTEHSPYDPKPRGAPFICLNATTGEEIWRITLRGTEWGGTAIMGDSIIVRDNTFDQRVYAIGKGPSEATVTASPKVSVHGSSVLVEGTVMDISPGTQDFAVSARFPKGVSAVSDDSMSDWMEYVYQQKPRPTNATGVEVVLEVLDPNNNYYEVGRTTSDADGLFHYAFTPEVPGEYTIIATFEGSEGYWPSHAETALFVEEAPAATPAPTPTPAPMTDTYVLGTGIAIIVAIAIVGFLILRKR